MHLHSGYLRSVAVAFVAWQAYTIQAQSDQRLLSQWQPWSNKAYVRSDGAWWLLADGPGPTSTTVTLFGSDNTVLASVELFTTEGPSLNEVEAVLQPDDGITMIKPHVIIDTTGGFPMYRWRLGLLTIGPDGTAGGVRVLNGPAFSDMQTFDRSRLSVTMDDQGRILASFPINSFSGEGVLFSYQNDSTAWSTNLLGPADTNHGVALATDGSSFVLCNEGLVTRYDPQGLKVWARRFEHNGMNAEFTAIEALPGGLFRICGRPATMGTPQLIVATIDMDGLVQEWRTCSPFDEGTDEVVTWSPDTTGYMLLSPDHVLRIAADGMALTSLHMAQNLPERSGARMIRTAHGATLTFNMDVNTDTTSSPDLRTTTWSIPEDPAQLCGMQPSAVTITEIDVAEIGHQNVPLINSSGESGFVPELFGYNTLTPPSLVATDMCDDLSLVLSAQEVGSSTSAFTLSPSALTVGEYAQITCPASYTLYGYDTTGRQVLGPKPLYAGTNVLSTVGIPSGMLILRALDARQSTVFTARLVLE